jgi:hypothetical protein
MHAEHQQREAETCPVPELSAGELRRATLRSVVDGVQGISRRRGAHRLASASGRASRRVGVAIRQPNVPHALRDPTRYSIRL